MNIPKIRFINCSSEYDAEKLGKYAKYRRGSFPQPYGNKEWYDGEASAPFVQVFDVGDNLKLLDDTKSKISKKAQPMSVKAKKGQVLVTLQGTIGRVAVMQYDAFVDRTILIFESFNKKTDSYYFANIIKLKFIEEARHAPGGIIKTITKEALSEFELNIPEYTEQKKVGVFVNNIDELIDRESKKLQKLKDLKSAMLTKMFPKKGSKVPEIRFKGFSGEWEEKIFEKTVTIERGGSPRPIEKFITKESNGLNWIKIGDAPEYGNYIIGTEEKIIPEGLSKTKQVHPNDLILSNSMSFGKPYILKIDGCIHDGWLLIRNDKNIYDLDFLCLLLSSNNVTEQYRAFAAGSTVNNLNKNLVSNVVICYPEIFEQQTIGKYFKNLNLLIEKLQLRLEKLTNLKQAFLSKMFV